MWGQYEESIKAWLHRISTARIKAPGRPLALTLHHNPNGEASTCPAKQFSNKNHTYLDLIPLELLHNIDMWYSGIVNCNQLEPVLVKLIQHHPVLCASTAYKLKYTPFEYYNNYDHIKCVWADIRLGPHNIVYRWGEGKILKHETVT